MNLGLRNQPQKLSSEEIANYARHLSIPGIGLTGQERLRAARVLVVGAGGLGSPILMYLAAAGVGTIGLVDDDVVDISNLQRQVVHSHASVGEPKSASARAFLQRLAPGVDVVEHLIRLDETNALDLVTGYDLVVDGSDNFTTRYLVNDACVLTGRPCIWGSVYQFSGQVSVFWAGQGPCYRCLFREPPPAEYAPSCAEGGVFGAVCGTIGSMQAAEAIKIITGTGEPLIGRVWVHDSAAATTRVLKFARDPRCPACGDTPTIMTPEPVQVTCSVTAVPLPAVDASTLRERLLDAGLLGTEERPGSLEVWDIREDHEWAGGTIPGARLIGLTGLIDAQPKDSTREVVIYCQSGIRSARALPGLLARGLPARHLEGGINAWLATRPAAEKEKTS